MEASKFLLVLLSLSSFSMLASSARQISDPQSSTEFIRTSCSSTTYPKLCFSSLSVHAALIQTSPKLLAHASLNVTLSAAKSTSAVMQQLSKGQGMSPREVAAMKDCLEEMSDTVDELRMSIGEMGQIKGSNAHNFGLLINDVQTWVSAALTDENTCSDGFQGKAMNGSPVRTAVRGRIVNIAHLTSNALALISAYASLHA